MQLSVSERLSMPKKQKTLEDRQLLNQTYQCDLIRQGAIFHLANFIAKTPCYDVHYSSTEDAYDLINQISLHNER